MEIWITLLVSENWKTILIRIMCPCVLYPLTPHFYIAKLGFTGVYIIFLFLLKNIHCGYSLEPLTEAVLMCTHNICFEQKYENSKKISTENCHFYSREKSLYIVWACFRNGYKNTCLRGCQGNDLYLTFMNILLYKQKWLFLSGRLIVLYCCMKNSYIIYTLIYAQTCSL